MFQLELMRSRGHCYWTLLYISLLPTSCHVKMLRHGKILYTGSEIVADMLCSNFPVVDFGIIVNNSKLSCPWRVATYCPTLLIPYVWAPNCGPLISMVTVALQPAVLSCLVMIISHYKWTDQHGPDLTGRSLPSSATDNGGSAFEAAGSRL